MDEILRKRIERKLDGLPEDKGYQVLDYIEFLESKYGTTARQPTPVERITEGVGDAMNFMLAQQLEGGVLRAADMQQYRQVDPRDRCRRGGPPGAGRRGLIR